MTNAERQKKWRERRNAERNKLVEIVTQPVTVKLGVTPEGVPEKEWEYACVRAERARIYAEKMPEFVHQADLKYQDPIWQWENEVRGRFGDSVGGSLSGSRP